MQSVPWGGTFLLVMKGEPRGPSRPIGAMQEDRHCNVADAAARVAEGSAIGSVWNLDQCSSSCDYGRLDVAEGLGALGRGSVQATGANLERDASGVEGPVVALHGGQLGLV